MGKGGVVHRALIERGRGILRGMGFTDSQIHQEYFIVHRTGGLHFQRMIDIVGESQDKKVAIECGEMNGGVNWRFSELLLFFDRVIWLPYLYTNTQNFDKSQIMSTANEIKEELHRQMISDPLYQLVGKEYEASDPHPTGGHTK